MTLKQGGEDKLQFAQELQAKGRKVAMAGDAINEVRVFAQANVGIGMGSVTDIAIEIAQITILKGDVNGLVKAGSLSEQLLRNIKQNLFFIVYNLHEVQLEAGVLCPFFGVLLSPIIAATAMSFSSVSGIVNALRLRNSRI